MGETRFSREEIRKGGKIAPSPPAAERRKRRKSSREREASAFLLLLEIYRFSKCATQTELAMAAAVASV